MADETGFQPDWVTSPAETIRRALIRRGWSIVDLADAMSVEEEIAAALVEGDAEIDERNPQRELKCRQCRTETPSHHCPGF